MIQTTDIKLRILLLPPDALILPSNSYYFIPLKSCHHPLTRTHSSSSYTNKHTQIRHQQSPIVCIHIHDFCSMYGVYFPPPCCTVAAEELAFFFSTFNNNALLICGNTPPNAIVALMSVSSSSSPRMASCRWRGVIRLTLRSLAALPASSRTSAVRYSRTAVTYTAADEMLAEFLWMEIEGSGRLTFGTNTHLVLGIVLEEALYTTAWELHGIRMLVNDNDIATMCGLVWFEFPPLYACFQEKYASACSREDGLWVLSSYFSARDSLPIAPSRSTKCH